MGKENYVSAKTIAEIQEERKANESKIASLESDIKSLEGDKNKEKAYQETLSQQIALIQDNILLLENELAQINEDITVAQTNIETLNGDIVEQEVKVDENIELFKERLCAMYVTGNSSLTSAILGSTDFYDMLSRVEMVNCIAEHDEELVNNILDEITTLEKSKSDLESEKLTLEMKQEEQENKKQQKETEIVSLNDTIKKSEAEVQRLALEQESKNKTKDELEAENKQLKQQEDEIVAQIKAAEEAAAKAAAAKKAADEAAAKAAQQQAANNSGGSKSSGGSSAPVVTEVDTSPNASGFAWPAPGYYYISSGYGARWGTTHKGIDIAGGGISGASACASKAGTVIAVSTSCTHNYTKSGNCCGNGYGNYVIISHDGTYSTVYGHLATVSVSVGDYVSQGQAVGTIGSTGFSTGFHLHFEVRKNGTAVNPQDYV